MRVDYHTHHVRCGHAVGELEEYVQRGIEIGLDQLGLSDHLPLIHVDPATYYPEMAMPMEELPRYVEECLHLKQKYSDRIDIRVGLEADYIEGYEETIERIITQYPFDYVIGSVHFLGEWDISDYRQTDGWNGREVLDVYRQYYDAMQKAAATGFYDIAGHLDVIKRFGYVPPAEQDAEREALEDAALRAVQQAGMTMELNSSGLYKACAEIFPARRIVEQAIALGIPLTLGSDAHDPLKLSDGLDQARALLTELGVEQIATFKERQRQMVPLNGSDR
ncbi:histidinol-phosphatase HisJ [Paenibacillus hunanensis]|nr:histidinol-phosphatase HisJ [Paenibacillus hunanensis]WPP41508.1 histidinol-phosphatase HisJ [Paenibacillus hunanensis]